MALDMDPHILNFYEDVDIDLTDVQAVITDALKGQLINPKEKLDGQNFAFIVDNNGQVRFMGKGCPKWIRARGGLTRDEMYDHYSDKPQVRDAFTGAIDALQARINKCQIHTIKKMMTYGVIESEVVTPINPNIVKYSGNHICIIGMHQIGNKLSTEKVKEFQNHLEFIEINDGWNIITVPNVEYKPKHDVDMIIKGLIKEFNTLIPEKSNAKTMGDLLVLYVKSWLKDKLYVDDVTLHKAAQRLVYEDSSYIKSTDFSKAAWLRFKYYDDERALTLGSAIAPIEKFFRKFSTIALEQYEFKLALVNDEEHVEELKRFVKSVRNALFNGNVKASSEKIYKRIVSACDRVDEDMLTRNVEGIVFEWQGQLRKLTGPFTAINRLHGYFYFEEAAKIIDSSLKAT